MFWHQNILKVPKVSDHFVIHWILTMNALMFASLCLKRAICSSREENQTENFNSYNINELIIQIQKYQFISTTE